MLTAKSVEAAKPQVKQYKLYDAQGLYLVVTPRSVKSWRCNYRQDGKNKTKVFGQFPTVTLSQARLLNVEFKDSLAEGALAPVRTFDSVKTLWYAHHIPKLKNAKHKQQVQYRLDHFVSPEIGSRELSTIRRADLVEIVLKVQNRPEKTIDTAHRVSTHIRQVFDYAVDLGYLEYHPAAGLSRVLKPSKSEPMPCVSIAEAPKMLKAINSLEDPFTRYCMLLLCLTFVRTTELRFISLPEIKDERFWVVPPERMKLNKPHVVPLSDFALKLVAELSEISKGEHFLMQSKTVKNQPVSENFFLDCLERLGYKSRMTGHGFRALASSVLNELSPFSEDAIERQLAHKESNAVRAVYNRAEYLDERVKLMAWYSEWVLAAIHSPASDDGAGKALKLVASSLPVGAEARTKAETRA